jgi:hypothetical protein
MYETPPPRVVFWQRVYCGVMGAVYLAIVVGSLLAAAFHDSLADADTSPREVIFGSLVIGGLSAIFAAVFLAGLFVPRRRWAWVYHLVLMGIGMTSCACLPFVVPLLVFWLRPEVQAYYGGAA